MSPSADAPNLAGPLHAPANIHEYYYAVLNLPNSASDQEIRERYRQLSIVFHPDKQVDEGRKDAATQRFLEVQKAYQILSDPRSRRAYDMLGPESLELIETADFNDIAQEEFDEELQRRQRELYRFRVEQACHPKSNVTIGIDASSLSDYEYEGEDGSPLSPWLNLRAALGDVRINRFSVRHRIKTLLGKKTWLTLVSRAGLGTQNGKTTSFSSSLMGTVQHQFSPRLSFKATTSLLRVSGLVVKSTYQTEDYVVACQSELHSAVFIQPFTYRQTKTLLLPPLTVSIFRRLFPKSPMQGLLEASIAQTGPRISVGVTSSSFHDSLPESAADEEPPDTAFIFRAPSTSGLSLYSTEWQIGFNLAGAATGLQGRYGVTFLELGLHIQAVLRLGLVGLTWLVGGEWRGDNVTVGANVSVNVNDVVFRVDTTIYGQTVSLPIILSSEHNESVGLWTAVIPSTVLAVVYYLKLRPWRRQQRIKYLHEARRRLRDENSELLRQWQETVYLLQDTAARHTRAEETHDGLIIVEAYYGPSERDEGIEDLDVNVTIPMQALVNSSQLYIPGKRSKVSISFRPGVSVSPPPPSR